MGETDISVVGGKILGIQGVNKSEIHKVTLSDGISVGSPSSVISNDDSVDSLGDSSITHTSSRPQQNYTSEPDFTGRRFFQCPTCGRKFSKPSKVKNHMHLHTGARPFTCKHPDCDKAYISSSHLLRHMKSHVPKTNPILMCSECKAIFRSEGGLRKHVKTIHESNEHPYSCQECGQSFRKKKLLNYHMHEHGGAAAFKCEHCNLTFALKHLYNRHLRGHKTHPCRVTGCSEVLPNWFMFRKHMAKHHREEGRECKECHKKFASSQSLYTHMELHRGKKDAFKCPHFPCGKAYSYRRNLNVHIQTRHIGVKFECDVPGCGRNLSSKQKLALHKLQMHNENRPNPYSRPHYKRGKERAPRKDKGKIKRAFAPLLAGLDVPYSEEKRLLNEDEQRVDAASILSSPESGFFSIPGTLSPNTSGCSDLVDPLKIPSIRHSLSLDEEPEDANDLQGPSETQRRNEEDESSGDDSFNLDSGGDSSEDESGSHREEDSDGDGDEGGEDEQDDEGGEDDDFQDDDDEEEEEDDDNDDTEEGNAHREEGESEGENHLPQNDGTNGKRSGNEKFTREDIPDGCGGFGVDRDANIPSVESDEVSIHSADDSGREKMEGCEDDNQRGRKRHAERDDDFVTKKKRTGKDDENVNDENEEGNGKGEDDGCLEEAYEEREGISSLDKRLDRNVDASIFETKLPTEKASKQLPEDVWISTFQKSIDKCLPPEELATVWIKEEENSL